MRPASHWLTVVVGTVEPGGFRRVRAWAIPGEVYETQVPRSPMDPDEVDSALCLLDPAQAELDRRRVGEGLFRLLFTGGVGELYQACREQRGRRRGAGPRVRLVLADPELHRFPWELLFDPECGDFLARRGWLSRQVGDLGLLGARVVRPPVRLLVADTGPHDPPADPAARNWPPRDAAEVREALAGLAGRRLEIETGSGVTLPHLRRMLSDAVQEEKPFTLVHLQLRVAPERPEAPYSFLFPDTDGGETVVSANDLAAALARSGVAAVTLGLARPELPLPDLVATVAAELAGRGIAGCVGVSDTTADQAGAPLLRDFYAALSQGIPLDGAVAAGVARTRHGGVPVCFVHTPTGEVLRLRAAANQSRRRAVRFIGAVPRRVVALVSVVMAAVTLLTTLLTNLLGLYDARPTRPQPPAQMTGDLRVAVAEFGERDDSGLVQLSTATRDSAAMVAEKVAENLKPLGSAFAIQVWGPREVGRLGGDSSADPGRWAEEVARHRNANILVYGVLDTNAAHTSFTPEFFIDRSLVPGAEELAGRYQFGSPVIAPAGLGANPVFQRLLRAELSARVQALAWFVLGVGHYALGHFDEAATAFHQAGEVPGWHDRDGREILFTFLGNTAGKRGDYPEAARWFEQALRINPRFGRAHVGQAETLFHLSSGRTCEEGRIDVAGLRQAVAIYQQAAQEVNPRPPLVTAKINFGLGRTYACLSQAGAADEWSVAGQHYHRAIQEGAHDAAARPLVADAWAGLALVALPPRSRPAPPTAYQKAAEAYQRAVDLTEAPERKAQLLTLLGYTHYKLDDPARARLDYQQAATLDPKNRNKYHAELDDLLGS